MMGENFIIIDFFSEDYPKRNDISSLAFNFESNSKYFKINYEVSDIVGGYYPQVGVSARQGICIMYRPNGDNNWYNIDCYNTNSTIGVNMTHFVEEDNYYEIIIYGPILAKLSKLQVTFSDDDYVNVIHSIPERSIAVAGGSNSLGIGCTTASCMFSNILERKLNSEVFHITYSSRNYLEDIYNFYMNSNPPFADIGIIEIDHFSQNERMIEEILLDLVGLMSKRCKYLIGWYSIPKSKSFKKIIANNLLRNEIDNDKIELLDLSYLYDSEYKNMCTYNNYYLNDTGNIIIYKKLEETIWRLEQWNI